jgi:uncharacterized protein YehS (DUF1456 family)
MNIEEQISAAEKMKRLFETVFFGYAKPEKVFSLMGMWTIHSTVTQWKSTALCLAQGKEDVNRELLSLYAQRAAKEGLTLQEDRRYKYLLSGAEYAKCSSDQEIRLLDGLCTQALAALDTLPARVSSKTRHALFKAIVGKGYALRCRDTMPRILVKGLPAIRCGRHI